MTQTLTIDAARRRGRRALVYAALLLATGAAASVWGWHRAATGLRAGADAEFDRFAQLAFANVQQRTLHQNDLLSSFQALFRTGAPVSRRDFNELFEDLRVSTRFPGVKAVQFAQVVSERERSAFEANVRHDKSLLPEGYPHFKIHPAGHRPMVVPVLYNEPMAGNEVVFGYDNAEEASRREVLERARDSGQPQSSAPVNLLQGETGYIVRVPVYRHGVPLTDINSRRAAYLGQISGVFLVSHLLGEVMDAETSSAYEVTMYDTGWSEPAPNAPLQGKVLFTRARSSVAQSELSELSPENKRSFSMAVGGRLWSIEVGRPSVNHFTATMPVLLLCAGLGLSLLVSGFVARISLLYLRATRMAEQLSASAQASVDRLDAVLNSTADGIVTIDALGMIVSANRSAQAIFGRDGAQLVGAQAASLLLPGGAVTAQGTLHQLMQASQSSGLGSRRELPAVRADGTTFPIELALTGVRVDGQRHYVGTLRDLTEAKAVEAAIQMTMNELQKATDLREAMFRNAAFAIVMTDAEGLTQTFNPAAEKLLARDASEVIARQRFDDFFDVDEHHALAKALSTMLGRNVRPGADFLAAAVGEGESVEHELHLMRGDRSRVPVSLTVSALREAGVITGFLHIAYDVSERRQLAAQLSKLAYSDGLTGLPNRMQLERDLEHGVSKARVDGTPLALLYIDLDKFKPINDTYGHGVGDKVLVEVAKRLRLSLRTADVAARIGGDEFVVLLTSLQQASDCALVADKLISALSSPMQFGELVLHVGASIGVVTYPEGGNNAEALLKQADAAMYAAKQAGRGHYRRGEPAEIADAASADTGKKAPL